MRVLCARVGTLTLVPIIADRFKITAQPLLRIRSGGAYCMPPKCGAGRGAKAGVKGFPLRRESSLKSLASPWIAGLAALELIVIGAEMTLAKPVGRAERHGLVSMLAAASTAVVMMNT